MADASTPKTGKDIHIQVETSRENGDFFGSIKLAQDAIITYLQEKNYDGLADIHGSIALSYRHLYKQTQDRNYLVLAEGSATTGIEIAKFNGVNEALAMPLFNLAKVQEELGQLGEACDSYKDAIDAFTANPPKEQNRPGVFADIKIHYFVCQYKLGDKSALPKLLDAIEELKKSGEEKISKYNFDVWLSGAHMSIFELLKESDKELAKKHLDEAKKIIDANAELKIRKEQWEKLAQNFL